MNLNLLMSSYVINVDRCAFSRAVAKVKWLPKCSSCKRKLGTTKGRITIADFIVMSYGAYTHCLVKYLLNVYSSCGDSLKSSELGLVLSHKY